MKLVCKFGLHSVGHNVEVWFRVGEFLKASYGSYGVCKRCGVKVDSNLNAPTVCVGDL